MKKLGRRRFLTRTGAVAAASSVPLSLVVQKKAKAANPWGDLTLQNPDDPISLPPGFSVTVLQGPNEVMSDGYRVPPAHDGMAAFAGANEGEIVLMRNHEVALGSGADVLNGKPEPDEIYESGAYGGVTRVVVDASTPGDLKVKSSNLVLLGTIRNCAGGPSPWGWISCEETNEQEHGFAFLCDATAESIQEPMRIDGYGRYRHEAAAVDPSNFYCYLTEDTGLSGLYRFVPDSMDDPFTGKLQAAKVVGTDNYTTFTMAVGDTVDIEWVDIDDPTPTTTTGTNGVFGQAQSKGALGIFRGEGCWFHDGSVYVCSTNGGQIAAGQIFRLIDGDAATLECVANSPDTDELDMPDNICVHPVTGEVWMAEDGNNDQFIRFIDGQGQVCDFAKNEISFSEIAGVCFSPDGKILFCNIQGNQLTLAIEGPFFDDGGDGDGDGDGGGDGGDGDGDGGGTGGSLDGDGEEDGCACATDPADRSTWGLVGVAASFVALRGITAGGLGKQRKVTGWFLDEGEPWSRGVEDEIEPPVGKPTVSAIEADDDDESV